MKEIDGFLLVSKRLEKFEQKLSKHFLYSFCKILTLHYYYFNWLVIKLRLIRKQKFLPSSLKLHYLQTIDFPHTIARKNFLHYPNFWFILKN